MTMLSNEILSDQKVLKVLEALQDLHPFTSAFNRGVEGLKDYILANYFDGSQTWSDDWSLEQGIFTWLFGEGHA